MSPLSRHVGRLGLERLEASASPSGRPSAPTPRPPPAARGPPRPWLRPPAWQHAAGAGGVKPAGGSPSNATWMWSWWAPSVKKPSAAIGNGVPTSVGRRSPVSAAISVASSRAAVLPGLTISPSTLRDVDPASDEVVGDRSAGGELVVAGLDHRQLDLVLLGELVEHGEHPRVHGTVADVLLRVGVEDQVLVLEQRLAERVGAPARRPPRHAAAAPALAGVAAVDGDGARGGRGLGLALEEFLGFLELLLVAPAELLGGALDVGDPFAEAVGVVDRLAGGDALRLDGSRRGRGTSRAACWGPRGSRRSRPSSRSRGASGRTRRSRRRRS